MIICVPVEKDEGLNSFVCAHFGSAPAFLLVDTETQACRAIINANQHHGHGMCAPLASLAGERIDAMIVGGIGPGALHKVAAAGIDVFLSEFQTVAEVVDAHRTGTLKPMEPGMACAHHGHNHHQ